MPRDSRPLLALVSLAICVLAPLRSGVVIAEQSVLSHALGVLVSVNSSAPFVSSPSLANEVAPAASGRVIRRTWHVTGSMGAGRYDSTTTLLGSGDVLVAGGLGRGEPPLSTAEVYHPETKRWSSTGGMNWERSSHTATLLRDNKVLVVGGYGAPSNAVTPAVLSAAEVYDPRRGRWQIIASMQIERYLHSATLLLNGKVLIAGGGYGKTRVLDTAELFDPTSHRWHSVSRMNAFRMQHTATLLPNGKVLVAGGTGGIAGSYSTGHM